MESKRFGTDGYRGVAGKELTARDAYAVGACLREVLGKRLKIGVGMDTRLSSPMLTAAIVSGILSSGSEAHIFGEVSTPAAIYLCDKLKLDIAVIVTASHNPFEDNGIKIVLRGGEKCPPAYERAIERYLGGEVNVKTVFGADIGRAYAKLDAISLYEEHLTELFASVGDGYLVGIDAANGAAYRSAPRILTRCGAKVYPIGVCPNGINVNDGCGSLHTEALSRLVRAEGLSVGFALDGDADRLIAVDKNGSVIDGDAILYILATYKKRRGVLKNNAAVSTVTSNGALEVALGEKGITLVKTPVGDKYVSDAMRRYDIEIGAESSGHVILSDICSVGDGVLTALSLLRVMRCEGASLSELSAEYIPYPSRSVSVACKDRDSVLLSERVLEARARAEAILGKGAKLLLRSSGTEEKIRILAEGEDTEFCDMAIDVIKRAILEATSE